MMADHFGLEILTAMVELMSCSIIQGMIIGGLVNVSNESYMVHIDFSDGL